jgi:hypothetical protein
MTPIYTGDIAPHSIGIETFLKQLEANKKAHREGLYKGRGVLNDHIPSWSKPLAIGSDWIALAKWIDSCRAHGYKIVDIIKSSGSGAGVIDNLEELHRSLFLNNRLNL